MEARRWPSGSGAGAAVSMEEIILNLVVDANTNSLLVLAVVVL